MKKSALIKLVEEVINKKLNESSKEAPTQNGTVIFHKSDFKNEAVWEGMLDIFDIPSGEGANWEEPWIIEMTVNSVTYDTD